MSKRLPPLNPLRAFEAAARHLSVSRAAEELNVTHGAVSHQIKSLETTLNLSLFIRDGNRLRLSPEGAALLPPVSGAFDMIAEAMARLTRPVTEGYLVVSCVPALLSFWLIPRLDKFSEQFPGIRLKCLPSNDASLIYSPEVDVCIRYGDGNWSDCWVSLLSPLKLFPVCSPTLRGGRPPRTVSGLSDHVLLHADDGQEWHSWLAAADAIHLARGRHHYMTDAYLAIEAAVHGNGVALGDTVTASLALETGRLIMPFELQVAAANSFYVAGRNEIRSAPIARAFVDWLYAEIAETSI